MKDMRRLAFVLALLMLGGCKKEEIDKTKLPPRDGRLGARRCTSLPGSRNKVLPVLQRPFDGQHPVFYLFDHETPGVVRPYDPASKETAYCGLEMFGLLEGIEGYSWGLPFRTPVLAAADGEVIASGTVQEYFCPLLGKMVENEQYVAIRHEDLGSVGFMTEYRSLDSITVRVGDKVEAGKRIGLSGKSGCVSEPLVYFVVKRLTGTKTGKPTPVDPYGWDGTSPDPWAKHPEGAQSVYLWKEGEAPTLGGR